MSHVTFFADTLRQVLSTSDVAVECVEVTGSTNDDLKERIRTQPFTSPILRTTHRQTAGRGTRGKTWQTPNEALLFTLALPYAMQGEEATRLPILVGISIAETLQRLGYPVRLKWPNDLWLADGKTGGILCEHLNGYAVIGVGLNLAASTGHTTQGWAIRSLSDHGKSLTSDSQEAAQLLAKLVEDLLETLAAFPKSPLHCLPALWYAVDAFANRAVLFRNTDDGRVIPGVARGITQEGALRLETTAGLQVMRNGSLCPLES